MKLLQFLSPRAVFLSLLLASALTSACAQRLSPIAAFPLDQGTQPLRITQPAQPTQPFTVAGPRGILVGTQDGSFESWILPVKLLSHITIEAAIEGYSVPIAVNQQAASLSVYPDHTVLTYAHLGFTLRQIMYSPDLASLPPGTSPVVLYQIESKHPLDLTFRFTPEMRWMWPKRNDGVPAPEWVAPDDRAPAANAADPAAAAGVAASVGGYYVLHMDYPDLAGAVTIPGAEPGILAPYQERPQVHPLELRLHYDPVRDAGRYFPLLMAIATSPETAQSAALGHTLAALNASLAASYTAHAAAWSSFLASATSIHTPDATLDHAFRWAEVSIEQLKAQAWPTDATALVAGYYASGDSARPGFGWFFGRDALYSLYAVNSFGDFALTRDELNFLIARQRADGKIMHEYSQTAADPAVGWKNLPYMYAAADSTPLFLLAMRDYYRASGDLTFLSASREAIAKAWAFETAASSDGDHDGIYDNSQGTGWVESWPDTAHPGTTHSADMPHQEIYMAALDAQASDAYAALAAALGQVREASDATHRATTIRATLEREYHDPAKGCYAFATNPDGTPNSPVDHTTTVYPAVAWWDTASPTPLAHADQCLRQLASPSLATDWGLRDVASNEPIFDGMSYHQGSVWPLFTGWAALAEYRGNQPLAGEQMLMQNVNLTWAQDPGAVTELLSGDTFVPFGRSTSHQLWSSAMVITPALRGLFGINVNAPTNTITVNPHLPATWDHATVASLPLGTRSVTLTFARKGNRLLVTCSDASVTLRTDLPHAPSDRTGLAIVLPAVELALADHALPDAGSATTQMKILNTTASPRSLTATLTAPAGSQQQMLVRSNLPVHLKVDGPALLESAQSTASAQPLAIHFPPGTGWQTVTITLSW